MTSETGALSPDSHRCHVLSVTPSLPAASVTESPRRSLASLIAFASMPTFYDTRRRPVKGLSERFPTCLIRISPKGVGPAGYTLCGRPANGPPVLVSQHASAGRLSACAAFAALLGFAHARQASRNPPTPAEQKPTRVASSAPPRSRERVSRAKARLRDSRCLPFPTESRDKMCPDGEPSYRADEG